MSAGAVGTQHRWARRRHVLGSRVATNVAIVLAYAVGAIAIFRPLSPLTNNYLSRGGIGDPAQMVWFLAYTPHALAHGLNPFWTNLIGYPTGVNLASNTSVPLLGFVAWPITATLGPIAAFNLLVRLGIALTAASFYFATARFAPSRLARFIGGACFGFGPYVIGQSVSNTHINLLFVAIVPVLVPILDELFVRQRWSWKVTGTALGIAAAGQMLIAPEVLSDFAIVAFAVVIYLGIRYRHLVKSRIAYAIQSLAISASIFIVICGYLIWEMLFGTGHLRGAVYPVAHLQSFRNSPVETLLPTMQQFLTTVQLSGSLHLPTRDLNEVGGYLSIPLFLAIVAIVIRWRKHYAIVPIAVGTAVAFVLSLGGSFDLGTRSIVLPERILTYLPLLKSTVPSRFALDTLLGACLVFAMGVDLAIADIRVSRGVRRRFGAGALAGTVALVLVALAPRLPIREQRLIWSASSASDIATHVTSGGVILAYPYPTPPLNEAMAWQAETGFAFTLLGGYATVPNERGEGQEWPLIQNPTEVQSYLSQLELGRRSRFPRISMPTNTSALCAYVERYKVTDFVVFRHSPRVELAQRYLSAIAHTTTFDDGLFVIYHIDRSRSGAVTGCA